MLLSLGMLMLSATQIYTIFTVQLFAFLNLLPVEADIAAVSNFHHRCAEFPINTYRNNNKTPKHSYTPTVLKPNSTVVVN